MRHPDVNGAILKLHARAYAREHAQECHAKGRAADIEVLTTSRQVLSLRGARRKHNELLSSDYARAGDVDTERADEEKPEVVRRERDRGEEKRDRRTAASPGTNPSLQHRRTTSNTEASRTAEERREESKKHRGKARER